MVADSRPVAEVRDAIISVIEPLDPLHWTREASRGGGVSALSTAELGKAIRRRLLRRATRT